MKRFRLATTLGLVIAIGVLVTAASAAGTRGSDRGHSAPPGDLTLELVGQVTNTGTSSAQYGYLAFVRGVNTIFSGSPQNESTALFTFYTEATTTRTIVNGPLRVITREGTTTIYSDPAGGSFANPDSFRDGTPIQVSTLRQQAVVDTLAATFTVMNLNTITSTTPFLADGRTTRLGKVGDRFRTSLTGHVNSAPPPSGHFAGFAVAVGGRAHDDDDD